MIWYLEHLTVKAERHTTTVIDLTGLMHFIWTGWWRIMVKGLIVTIRFKRQLMLRKNPIGRQSLSTVPQEIFGIFLNKSSSEINIEKGIICSKFFFMANLVFKEKHTVPSPQNSIFHFSEPTFKLLIHRYGGVTGINN